LGFKLIPLGENGKPVDAWTVIYENPDYWSSERFVREAHKFQNVATCFGKTHLKDDKGEDLYLNCLDIDSDNVYKILFNLKNGTTGKEYSFIAEAMEKTHVTKTRKPNGFHIYWLSHKQNKAICTVDCKPGFEFEIKTDKRGHCTLPPSTHRDDNNFHYKNFGQDTIITSDKMYSEILKVLSECLRNKKPYDRKVATIHPKAACMNVDILLTDNDIEEIISQIKGYYRKGCRQNMTLGLSGLLYKSGIGLESAEKVVVGLCNATSDEEKVSRVAALRNTYTKGQSGKELVGASLLSEVLTVDVEAANDILNNITFVWKKYKNPILLQLQDHIRQELQPHVVEVLCYTPLEFVVAHSHKKQILYAKIDSKSRENNETLQEGKRSSKSNDRATDSV
jgi:hypothetical protein